MGGGFVDVGAFLIEQFENPDQLMHRLRCQGLPCPSNDAAAKWFQRRSLPGDWMLVLVHLLNIESTGKADLAHYINKAKENE